MFPLPTVLMIKIGAALALCAVMYFMGYSHEHKRFVQYKAEVAAVGKAQEVINQAKVKEHEFKATAIKDEYEGKLAAVNNYYADRVRDASTNGGSVSSVSRPAVCVNATPANTISAGQCAETTLQLVQLQKWIESVKK